MFYRCRISTEEGIPIEKMGAPPIEKTTDGRANARGIRCLYLGVFQRVINCQSIQAPLRIRSGSYPGFLETLPFVPVF